jgi:hypothetical protein
MADVKAHSDVETVNPEASILCNSSLNLDRSLTNEVKLGGNYFSGP